MKYIIGYCPLCGHHLNNNTDGHKLTYCPICDKWVPFIKKEVKKDEEGK